MRRCHKTRADLGTVEWAIRPSWCDHPHHSTDIRRIAMRSGVAGRAATGQRAVTGTRRLVPGTTVGCVWMGTWAVSGMTRIGMIATTAAPIR
ncbi:hypothetical protein LX83_000559 [Goodfellowiella coeruleoviolacea]|uniref:Uncharacterized protein n=1 Tax=Goodfellowiella coeruleoviolacea TaxID=334858 RepID=A0AAE3GA78_9PSEU|nr:hypothetical protein [Goodfellowiella coeruleoviolacea]